MLKRLTLEFVRKNMQYKSLEIYPCIVEIRSHIDTSTHRLKHTSKSTEKHKTHSAI